MTSRSVVLVVLLMLLGVACDTEVTAPELEPVASVDVSAPAFSLAVGGALQLTATPRASDGRPLQGRAVAWSSSDEAVARVSGSGVVTGRGEGPVRIYAESGGRRGEVQLVVHSTAVARVAIDPPGEIVIDSGATLHLRALAFAADDTELSDRAVTWTSSHDGIARMGADGVLHGRGVGTGVVTARIEGVSASATVRVRRVERSVAAVQVSPVDFNLEAGAARQLTVRVLGTDSTELYDRTVSWSTSDEAVATVGDDGLVVARGGGVAWITATSDGVSGQARVAVPGWAEASLARLDRHPLPAVWRTFTVTDDRGIELTRVIRVVAGALRLDRSAERYEQRLTMELWEDVYLIVNGQPVFWGVQLKETRVFDDHGTAQQLHSGVNTLAFRSEVLVGHTFTGLPTATGFDVTERINGSGDPVLLQFER